MLYLNILLILSVIADGVFSQQPRGQPPPINQFQQPQPGAVPKARKEFAIKQEVHDKEHLKEHLKNKIDVDSQSDWSDEKEVFYYFELADLNKDFYIDGLELIQTVTAHEHSTDPSRPPQNIVLTDAEAEAFVDPVLDWADKDRDGRISFSEYKAYLRKP